MPKKKKSPPDREIYNGVVFQGASVVAGPDDMGILEIWTNDSSFGVMLNHDNAAFLIEQLQDLIAGKAPHFARDRN